MNSASRDDGASRFRVSRFGKLLGRVIAAQALVRRATLVTEWRRPRGGRAA